MRTAQPFVLLSFVAFCSICTLAQQPTTSPSNSTQAPTAPQLGPVTFGPKGQSLPTPPPLAKTDTQGPAFLQQCVSAVGAASPVADVTLTGNITVLIPGGTTDTGTIIMVARGDSQAEITMQMATGTRTEVRSLSSDGVAAQMRTGPDGTVTHSKVQSLLTPHPAWFFPQFVLAAQPQANVTSAFIGAETRAGVPVNHVEIWQLPSTSSLPAKSAEALQHDTQYDVYLDPATSLPVAMVYWVQPDYPTKQGVPVYTHRDTRAPVEMRFSDYQKVQGVPVALHIQTFIQGRQIYDIQLSSAMFDTSPVIPTVN